jgi:hypothetical protein
MFDATETTPAAPPRMARAKLGSSPLSRAKPAPPSGYNASQRASSPRASFSPMILGSLRNSATVSGSRSQPVRPGTLYSTSGKPPCADTWR